MLFAACVAYPTWSLPHFTDDLEPGILAERIVEEMTDAEAVGQVLMFGYPTENPDPTTIRWIEEEGLGSIKVFGWNARNLAVLAETIGEFQRRSIQGRFGIPLLVATDQEGGWVRHIKGASSVTPGNMALGASTLPYDSWMTGRLIAQELAAVGVNMNFAPTVDVYVDPRADVIGPRAFGADPTLSGLLAEAFVRGQESMGVISTAKHFPGHGDTSADSHGTLPEVLADLETLRNRDWIPYRILIAGDLPSVMVGHLAFPEISGEGVPATVSHRFLTEILRDEMGFEGVVVTDDLFMVGARRAGQDQGEVASLSLRAGADLLLISQTPQEHLQVHRRLLGEMAEDEGFNARVREAAERVIRIKAQYLKGDHAVPLEPDPNLVESLVPAPDSEEFFLGQAARSITVVGAEGLPVETDSEESILLAGSYSEFILTGRRRYPSAQTYRLPYSGSRLERQSAGRELRRLAQSYDRIIVLLSDANGVEMIEGLEDLANHVTVLSILSPAHLDELPWVQSAVVSYGTGRESFEAAFAVIAGDFQAQGRIPIPLENHQ